MLIYQKVSNSYEKSSAFHDFKVSRMVQVLISVPFQIMMTVKNDSIILISRFPIRYLTLLESHVVTSWFPSGHSLVPHSLAKLSSKCTYRYITVIETQFSSQLLQTVSFTLLMCNACFCCRNCLSYLCSVKSMQKRWST